jgi:hypothetical protein
VAPVEKKVIVVFVLLFCLLYTTAIVAQDRKSSFTDSNAAKAEVNQLGFGKRVNVKLQGGGKATGRITGFDENHFIVTNGKGVIFKIDYVRLSRIERQNEKLRLFEKPFGAFAIIAALVGTFVVMTMASFK